MLPMQLTLPEKTASLTLEGAWERAKARSRGRRESSEGRNYMRENCKAVGRERRVHKHFKVRLSLTWRFMQATDKL